MAKVFMRGSPNVASLGEETQGMNINHRTRMLEAIRSATNLQICGTEKKALFPQRKLEVLRSQWEKIDANRKKRKDKLVETFKKECERLPATVYLSSSGNEAADLLSSIIKKTTAKKIIKWTSPVFNELAIDSLLKALDVEDCLDQSESRSVQFDKDEFRRSASQAEIGISGADYGLADTGTLVMRSVEGQDRITSLLPPIHIALLEADRILSGIDDLIARLLLDPVEKGRIDSCLTLITGPSKTADIEMSLVHGIHGPRSLHVLILQHVR
jgi:L-lactate dehydrogenase complex protein LldG